MPLMSFMKCIFFTWEKKRKKNFFFCENFPSLKIFFMRENFFPHLWKNKNMKNIQKITKNKWNFLQFKFKILKFSLNFSKISSKIPQHPALISHFCIPGCSFFILFLSIFIHSLASHLSTKITAHVNALILTLKKISLTSPRAFLSVFIFFFLVLSILPKYYVLCSICEYFYSSSENAESFLYVSLLELRLEWMW